MRVTRSFLGEGGRRVTPSYQQVRGRAPPRHPCLAHLVIPRRRHYTLANREARREGGAGCGGRRRGARDDEAPGTRGGGASSIHIHEFRIRSYLRTW